MAKSNLSKLLLPISLAAAFGGGVIATSASADQPFMHDALDQLRVARATLAAGSSYKGGHRVRAMAYVDRAIGEVRAGVDFDRRH